MFLYVPIELLVSNKTEKENFFFSTFLFMASS